MANRFPSRKINLAVNLIQAQPRPRLASSPKEPSLLKLSLITGGHHGKSSPARNAFSAKNRILEQEENVLFVNFASSESKSSPKTQISSAPREQTPQSISTKEGTFAQTKNAELESMGAFPKQFAAKAIKLLTDMCNAVKSQSSVQKGLRNKCSGRFDQTWVLKWFSWFSFVVAMTRKVWDTASNVANKLHSNNVRAESAKTPHAA